MILLSASQIYKSFGTTTILNGATLTVQTKDRIGLVGPNGAGKTTLLKTLLGEIKPDQGEVHLAKEASVGYLSQHDAVESTHTVYEELMLVFQDVQRLEERMRELELQMSLQEVYENESRMTAVSNEYSRISDEYSKKDGYAIEAKVRSILSGLDFPQSLHSRSISTLSGGQKTRLALGKLLLQEPTLLILDEPTNYLDIPTMTWLENYLKNYPGALLLVSHDRYFLDALVTQIYELENGQTSRYVGNYSDYIVEKAERLEQELKRYEQQQTEIARMQDFIQRNIVRATTTRRAQSRRKMLEKMERFEKPDTSVRKSRFSFEIARESGREVLDVQNASLEYSGSEGPLFEQVSFQIFRGERAALLGPNGAGKSSLFKSILGWLPLKTGTVRLGTNVTIGYYTQEQEDLNPTKTVLQEVWDAFPKLDQTRVRTILGNFLFSGDDVNKPIHSLSGGERARVALSKLMLLEANFLLLDEPTNHLDLISKEVLETALEEYPGTILLISHDRYFLNRIATRILELSPTGIAPYTGNYEDYVEKKAQLIAGGYLQSVSPKQAELASKSDEKEMLANEREARREQEKAAKRERKKREEQLQKVEEQIGMTEQRIAELEQKLCLPEIFEDHEQARILTEQYEHEKLRLSQLYTKWEELMAAGEE